jgi:hypothetical protein
LESPLKARRLGHVVVLILLESVKLGHRACHLINGSGKFVVRFYQGFKMLVGFSRGVGVRALVGRDVEINTRV